MNIARKPVTGIFDIDYPGISDAKMREVQLGDPEKVTLPDGRTVAEYTAEFRGAAPPAVPEAPAEAPAPAEAEAEKEIPKRK